MEIFFQEVVQAIATVGFPAVCCICMLYMMFKNQEREDQRFSKLQESDNQRLFKLQEVIRDNTAAINEMIGILKGENTLD
jgi:hypothetical protein